MRARSRPHLSIPAAAGVVLLCVWTPPSALVGGGLLAVSVWIRLRDLRTGSTGRVPWSMTIIAMVLPAAHADRYLNDLGSYFRETRGAARKRGLRNVIVTAPAMIATAWSGWVRTRLVIFAVRTLFGRIARIERAIRESPVKGRLRRLRLFCWLIRRATGGRQYCELADAAHALSRTCRRFARSGAPEARVRQEASELVAVMDAWRPHRL